VRVLAVVEEGGRLGAAAAGLALRGHEVAWAGRHPAPAGIDGVIAIHRRRDLWGMGAEVLVSDWRRPLRPAFDGWQAGAVCQVQHLTRERVRAWSWLDHAAWESLPALGLIEPQEADVFRAEPLGLEPERLAPWSDTAGAAEPDPAHPDTEVLERACQRARARHLSRGPRAAVFLDRDGTLVREVGYLSDPADLEVLPGVPEALRSLQAAGYPLVVISNQSGVGRGLFPMRRVHEAMALLRRRLAARGVELDGIYFCPHRPDEGCACRKPGTALLERAASDLGLGLRGSFMIGDKRLDAATAHAVGARGLLVRTGYGRDEEQRAPEEGAAPDAVCDDLAQATAWILDRVNA
jgi:D-glycero-D-manno-heptose 1,7-bisphosphate phosphatase